ncbi:unnamed protein product [Trichobilharzia szidati]|nr:unnamed protein product [Trichobilharzia szidati]
MQSAIFSCRSFPNLCNYYQSVNIFRVLLGCRKCCLQTKAFQPQFDLNLLNDEKFVHNLRANLAARKNNLDIDYMLNVYKYYEKEKSQKLLDELMSLVSQLPNFTHPLTPVGDATKARSIYIHGSKRQENWDLLDVTNIALTTGQSSSRENNVNPQALSVNPGGHLRVKHTSWGAGQRTYYFGGQLALLESALVAYTLDRLKGEGFGFTSVPDILPEPVITACGFPTKGIRSQVYKITPPLSNLTYCLSGTSEMSLAGFCAGRSFNCPSSKNNESDRSSQISALGLCAVSRCFRKEAPQQEPTLYRVHQFTKVEMFCVTAPVLSISDAMFDRIIKLQICLFADLGLHFRVLEMPSEELGDSACRKVDIEAWMPGDQMYGEISSASNCLDYQSKRLNIRWQTCENQNEFAYTLNGTACAIPRIMKALIETHQTKDRQVVIPDVLKPYMKMKSQYPTLQFKRLTSE